MPLPKDKVSSEIDLGDEDTSSVDLGFTDDVEDETKVPEIDLDDLDIEIDEEDGDSSNEDETTSEDTEDDEDGEEEEQTSTADDKSKTKKPSRSQERIQQLVQEKKAAEAKTVQANAIAARLVAHLQTLETERQTQAASAVDSDAAHWLSEVERATSEYESALEEADSKKIAAAQRKLSDAQFKNNVAQARKTGKTTPVKPEDVVRDLVAKAVSETPIVETQTQAPANPKAAEWITKNQFILGRADIKQSAVDIFGSLEGEGFNLKDEKTFAELEDRMAILHPELDRWFSKGKTAKVAETTETETKKKVQTPPTANQSRSTAVDTENKQGFKMRNGKVVVKTTEQDRSMATQLGLNIADYMKEKIKFDMASAKGSRSTAIFD